jgi:putative FmdB family regulatory protein
MPFYEYECQSCKFYTEVMQKISEPPLVKCPSCGKRTLKKLVSAPVFRLKGSGWYETDFKSEKEEKRNLATEREESKPAAEESKSEAAARVQPGLPAATGAAAKPSEPETSSKAPGATSSVTTRVTTAAAPPKARAASAPKRPAAKVSRGPPSRRPKAKPGVRTKAAKRGSRR